MMKSNVGSAYSWILLLFAASSLLSMIGLTQIDKIVHHDLYRYGLQFSYQWAMPYWTMTAIVFAVGWFNIILAITFQFYVLLSRRTEAEVSTVQAEPMKSKAASMPQPAEEKQAEMEKTKEAEKPEETPKPTVEAEQKHDEKTEETPKKIEGTAQPEPSEAGQSEQEQKQQEAKPTESTEPNPEVAPAPPAEKQPETQEKREETPTLVGVP